MLDLARTGDAIAIDVRRQAAQELCGLVLAVQRALKLPVQHLPVAVAGGVLLHSHELKQELVESLAEAGVGSDLINVPNPVAGAVTLASDSIAV